MDADWGSMPDTQDTIRIQIHLSEDIIVRKLKKNERLSAGSDTQDVFLIGSRGIPSRYGGFETFVQNLTRFRHDPRIQYHVARLAEDSSRFEYQGAEVFDIPIPKLGKATAVVYDVAAMLHSLHFCRKHKEIKHPVFYILACRIGPLARIFAHAVHRLGGICYLNPDGHEWKRSKWSPLVRRYWKFSEGLMVKHADLVICDSRRIEQYIKNEYRAYTPRTTFISYGSDTTPSSLTVDNETWQGWAERFGVTPGEYYLVVGRLVPENNYAVIIREFIRSASTKKLVIISTGNVGLLNELDEKYHYRSDPRVAFVGTMYDPELLKLTRENAFAYIHGHEVGGTNPSLLESLGHTDVNLLYDVAFNYEVAEESALYWTKAPGNLARLINRVDAMPEAERKAYGERARDRMQEAYSWEGVVDAYEKLFLQ